LKINNLIFLISFLVIVSCGDDVNNNINQDAISEIGSLPNEVIYPSNNPYSIEKEELGRSLFWDPILSGNRDIACASCHHPDHGYADGIERSLGVGGIGLANARQGGTLIDRNSPTVINTAFNGISVEGSYNPQTAPMFWDLRESSLETQAIQPILSAEEMRGDNFTEEEILNEIVSRLQNIPAYVNLFNQAFGSDAITSTRIADAIATFERGITSNNSRFDQYINGDENTLTNLELEGLNSFLDAGCADCHNGPMFSDFELHTLGVPNNGINDSGANGNFDFRTPTLKNIELTAPYMHNGRFETLEDVVDFYDDLSEGRNNAINNNINFNEVDEDARDLDLGRGDINEIVAFLRTLTDENFDRTIPSSVPSQLPVGGDID